MGSGSSKSEKILNFVKDIKKEMELTCQNARFSELYIQNIKVRLSGKCDRIAFTNDYKQYFECDKEKLFDMMAKTIENNLDYYEKQKLGLEGMDLDQIKDEIKIKFNTSCKDSGRILQSISNLTFDIKDDNDCELLKVFNESDVTTLCTGLIANDMYKKIDEENVNTEDKSDEGLSTNSKILIGLGVGVGILCFCVIFILIIIIILKKNNQ